MKAVVIATLLCTMSVTQLSAQGEVGYKPKRINKMIELLEAGQPVYYATARGGSGYEEGLKLAQTWADYINYEMEHGTFDLEALRQFMQGLVKGGPTKSGHRTPAVIVTLPILGYDEISIRANYWMIHQVLATGVHGIQLCHARSPEAIKLFVAACRYPFERPGVRDSMLEEGMRGAGSQGFASQIWGISANEYLQVADPWPLNPKGEIILGLKIEDKHALANAEKNAAVPGIGFTEWGSGDMSMSLLGISGIEARQQRNQNGEGTFGTGMPPLVQQARARVMAAAKASKIAFLNTCTLGNVESMIKEGVMICSGSTEAIAEKGRQFTHREMPR